MKVSQLDDIIIYVSDNNYNAEDLGKRSVNDFGYAKSSEDTSGDWDVNPGEDWPKYPRSSSPCGKGLMSNVAKSDNASVGNSNASSQNWAIPSGSATKLRSIEGKTKDDTLESTKLNSEHGKANSNSGSTSHDTSQANSEAASVQDESNRATLAPVRRVHLQQQSLQNSTKVEEPKREDLPISPHEVKDTVKEKAKENVKKKQLLETLHDKPRVTKVTSNQVSRSSHRSFLQPAKDDDVTAANASKKSQSHPKLGKKPERKANQKREDRTPGQVKGANQLLVASASQVGNMSNSHISHRYPMILDRFRPTSVPSAPSSRYARRRSSNSRRSICRSPR